MKYAWIESQRHTYSVTMMCELLGVSRSGWYGAARREVSQRRRSDERLIEEIRQRQSRHRGCYGRRRMSREISRAWGQAVNCKRVARLMREAGLQSRTRRRFRVSTTDSLHGYPVAHNVLARQFVATRPNQKWLADMTCVPTTEGVLYVALILDLYSRKMVGWAMSHAMPQSLTLRALSMALGWRKPPAGLIHHSDRGSQYACRDYQAALREQGIKVSMSRKGNCWDNAPMESANATVKVECVHPMRFETRSEAAQALVEYLGYYNTERLHSSLGYQTPSEFERRWSDEHKRVAK